MAGLPLELLTSFGKIAEHASITLAARDLGLSKATVSKHLNELEARLGVVLFARTTRMLTLTHAGEKAYSRTKTILDEADLLTEEAHDSAAAPRGQLKIAAPGTFSRLWLSDILPEFMVKYPEIKLDVSVDDRTVDLIKDGFDGALRISAMPDSSLIARRLAPVKMYLVGAPGYWKKHGKPSHPHQLVDHHCIRYANLRDQSTWKFHDAAGIEARVAIEGNLTVNGGGMEMPALRAGLGIAILPDFAVCHDVREGRLETAMCEWTAPDLTLHFLTPPGRGKPKRLQVFTDFLVHHFGGRVSPWHL
jgi:DNA-binding transcriptional LysR family regulator